MLDRTPSWLGAWKFGPVDGHGFRGAEPACPASAPLWLRPGRSEGSLRRAASSGAADRTLNAGAAFLALAVLADSGLEHYRALFRNRAMYAGPGLSALTLAASLHALSRPSRGGAVGTLIFGSAILAGFVGTGFHTYNVGKREGGYNFLNLFYAAPLGAPAALSMAGLFALAAARELSAPSDPAPRARRGRLLAAAAAVGLLGTTAEVVLFHYRGAFHNRFMFLPVSIPPAAAAALAAAATAPSRAWRPLAKLLLRATGLLGAGGIGFHAYGVHRNMGGWRNWRQNILSGPPLPAPLGFVGLAMAGLGALAVMEERP